MCEHERVEVGERELEGRIRRKSVCVWEREREREIEEEETVEIAMEVTGGLPVCLLRACHGGNWALAVPVKRTQAQRFRKARATKSGRA